jgi:hypothetical protein
MSRGRDALISFIVSRAMRIDLALIELATHHSDLDSFGTLAQALKQCCWSGQFLTGSDFLKHLDPDPGLDLDPYLNKFRDKFLLEIFIFILIN